MQSVVRWTDALSKRGRWGLASVVGMTLCSVLPAVAQIAPLAMPAPGVPAQPAAPPPVQAPEGAVGGMGDVNIYPKRVVLDDHQRIGSIGLFNRTIAAGEYEITLSDLMMTTAGRLVDLASITDPAVRARAHPAGEILRWSPHRVTLPGNEAQTVRVMLNARPSTPPGEYRSHFMILSVPPSTDGLSIDDAAGQKPNGIGVRIIPRFGISIPVIVRIGDTTLDVGLRDPAVVPAQSGGAADGKVVSLTILRSGTRSAFGDITITAPGSRAPIAQMKGVGVYTEVDERQVQVPIDPKADPKFTTHGAHLTITYTDDDVTPGKTLARQEFVVP